MTKPLETPAHDSLSTYMNRDQTIWTRKQVRMPLVVRKSWEVEIGFCLLVDEADKAYHLYSWIWTLVRHRDLAIALLQQEGMGNWVREKSEFYHDLGRPQKNERFADIGSKAAETLWPGTSALFDAIVTPQKGRARSSGLARLVPWFERSICEEIACRPTEPE